MSQATKIEWTDAVWNPVRGCSRVSKGCTNCYAERMAARFSGKGQPYEGLAVMKSDGPHWTGKVRLVPELLDWPRKWKGSPAARKENRPSRIFVNSMSDLFHESLPDGVIAAVFLAMAACAEDAEIRRAFSGATHIFQVLTKRARRAHDFVHGYQFPSGKTLAETPLPNVWLGVSVEDQATADERVPILLGTPAAVRWISAEPLLGPITFRWARWNDGAPHQRRAKQLPTVERDGKLIAGSIDELDGLRMLDWVVVGGESGPGARPMHPEWARSLRDQCQAANVPFFFKQWGEWVPGQRTDHAYAYFQNKTWGNHRGRELRELDSANLSIRVGKKAAGRLLDGREWNEFPEARA